MLPPIDVAQELSAAGVEKKPAGDGELRILCPFHEDSTPSCDIHTEKQVFVCRSCSAAGDLASLFSRIRKHPRADVVADFKLRYGDVDDKPIEAQVVEKAHKNLSQKFKKELARRSIYDNGIRKYRLGEQSGRITIPIRNSMGQFVNIRKHAIDGGAGKKVINIRGRGKMRLFPIDQFKHDTIVIVGGELKAIACEHILNPLDIGVVTASGGEGNWKEEFNPLFRDKKVYVCLDIDETGVTAAEIRCIQLFAFASTVHFVKLPLSVEEFPNGDVADFLSIGGDLPGLLERTEVWEPENEATNETAEAIALILPQAIQPENTLKRISLSAVASAIDSSPYLVPKDVTPSCDKSQPMCGICPLKRHVKGESVCICPESEGLIEMTATTKKARRDAIMHALGVPKCKSVDFAVTSYYKLDDAIISDDLNIVNVVSDKTRLNAIFVDCDPQLLETYELTGKIVPHPKTQKAAFIVSKSKPIDDSLSTFKLEQDLAHFQPDKWTVDEIENKLNAIYGELEPRVTRIYERRDMHILVDLAYHSTLFMRVGDMSVKAWVEVLIAGDSSQGKSWVTGNLAEFYGLGEKVECKNATVAGLLGGLQKVNERWFASWGVIPTHDRRLVILEELKGMHKSVFSKLTDMRSSGIAEIPKIERQRTHARTRLIALSNPRSALPVSSYSFGIEVVRELIINLEDVRRFDACMVIGESEVSPSLLQIGIRDNGNSEVYDQASCRSLILWAWTRTAEQVVMDPIWDYICEVAGKICARFTERIPIVDKGSMKYKLGRLAAAVACRTFSTDDGETLVVRRCHVDFIERYLTRIYSTAVFGYDRYTDAITARESLKNPEKLRKVLLALPHRESFIPACLAAQTIDAQDVSDWTGYDMGEAKGLMSVLVRSNALVREQKQYRKTPKFIVLLKQIEAEGPSEVPSHMKEDVEIF